jgi:hypothetical protein
MEPDKGPRVATSQPSPRNGLASARRGIVVPNNNSSLAVQLQWLCRVLARDPVMVGKIGGNDYNYARGCSTCKFPLGCTGPRRTMRMVG